MKLYNLTENNNNSQIQSQHAVLFKTGKICVKYFVAITFRTDSNILKVYL